MSKNEKYIKRNSPPFHAKDYPNKVEKGNDGLNYISIKDKNNIYKWIKYVDIVLPNPEKYKNRVYTGSDYKYYYSKKNRDNIYYWIELKITIKKSPDEFYKQFPNYEKPDYDLSFFTSKIKDLTRDFKKIGILLYVLKWNKESLYSDHLSIITEKIQTYLEENVNYSNGYIFTSEYLLYNSSFKSKDEKIYLYHIINGGVKNNVNEILTNYFPNKTIGIQNSKDAITINIHKSNNLKTKKWTLFKVNIKYVNKIKISGDDFNKVHNHVTEKIVKKYVYDLRDAYNSMGSITLYYTVYDDKIVEFSKKIKDMKIRFLPKIKLIEVFPIKE